MNKLSDWKWAIEFSGSVGQKDAKIPPMLFESRSIARRMNNLMIPKGRVVAVVIKEIKRK